MSYHYPKPTDLNGKTTVTVTKTNTFKYFNDTFGANYSLIKATNVEQISLKIVVHLRIRQ